MPPTDAPEEMLRDNEINFVDALQSQQGSLKFMSEEEKRAIHAEIDQRMNELESTGLSRFEILHDEPNKGVKL